MFFVFSGSVDFLSWHFETDELVEEDPESLKEVYSDRLTLGMCLNPNTISPRYKKYVTANFSNVTCENEMKADSVINKALCQQKAAENQAYVAVDFSACKDIIKYCIDNDLKMRYHTLVCQNQTPDWFFYEDYDTNKSLVDEKTMKQRMENYINQVISYFDTNYPGLIYAIDVVNEAFNGEGPYKVKETDNKWYEVQITELDIGIPKVKTGATPSKEQYIKQGEYVKTLMEKIMELKAEGCNISAITLWGINDANSWRSNVDGYNAYGLLWMGDMSPKPALRGFALCEDVLLN